MTANDNGDDNIPPPQLTTSQTEERLVRNDITNKLYMPLSSTIALRRKTEMLYVPLDSKHGLKVDALVDIGAYVSSIAPSELDIIKQQAPTNIFKVAHGQLRKPITTVTPKFDIGDNAFAEHFVARKNLTGPFLGLHFMKHNSLFIDITHGLIHFPHLTRRAKNAAIETSDKPLPVFIHDNTIVPPMTVKTITTFVDYPSEWHTTGTVIPVGKFTEAASLLKSHST